MGSGMWLLRECYFCWNDQGEAGRSRDLVAEVLGIERHRCSDVELEPERIVLVELSEATGDAQKPVGIGILPGCGRSNESVDEATCKNTELPLVSRTATQRKPVLVEQREVRRRLAATH